MWSDLSDVDVQIWSGHAGTEFFKESIKTNGLNKTIGKITTKSSLSIKGENFKGFKDVRDRIIDEFDFIDDFTIKKMKIKHRVNGDVILSTWSAKRIEKTSGINVERVLSVQQNKQKRSSTLVLICDKIHQNNKCIYALDTKVNDEKGDLIDVIEASDNRQSVKDYVTAHLPFAMVSICVSNMKSVPTHVRECMSVVAGHTMK